MQEYYNDNEFTRFLNQTFGVTLGDDSEVPHPHPNSHIITYLAIGSVLGQVAGWAHGACV
jgi:hypothetical protein